MFGNPPPRGVSLFPGRYTFPYRNASEQSPAGKAGGHGTLCGLLYKASPGNSTQLLFPLWDFSFPIWVPLPPTSPNVERLQKPLPGGDP